MLGAGARDPRVAALRDALPGQVLLGTGGVRYHLRERIGEGGQGWVYRATWDEPDGFFVTVKVLRPDAVSHDTLARFQREAEVLRTLSQQSRPNPHIVRFFDHATARLASPRGGEPITIPFTVLEYVHGSTLERALALTRGQGLPLDRVRRLLRHVVLALEDVHRHDVVHRDLKPSNILLAYEQDAEVAKVTDFGLVKLVDIQLQQTTALAGASLGYAPPEQYEQGNQRVSPRTDVFSLAAIAYEMLCGTAAFPYREGEHPLVVVTRLLNNTRPLLAQTMHALCPEFQTRPYIVALLDAELSRALSPDPAQRHESASAFWAALEPLLRAPTAHATQPSAQPLTPTPVPPAPGGLFGPGAPGAAPPRHSVAPPKPHDTTMVSPVGFVPQAPAPRRSNVHVVAPVNPRASNPSSWGWRLATRPLRSDALRTAYFDAGGDVVIAAGASGLLRWDRLAWVTLPLPPEIDVRAIRGVLPLPNNELLVFGDGSLAGRLRASGASGTFEPWLTPDPTITFHGGHVDEASGIVTLVGERPGAVPSSRAQHGNRVGCIAQFAEGRLVLMTDAPTVSRLRAVSQLVTGAWVACGDWGAVVRLASGVAEHVGSVCGGHLTSIVGLQAGGAVTVGVGGHALYLSQRLEPQLEAVQTTRDLLCIGVGDDGVPWAGAAQARVLRRASGSWIRMSGEVGLASAIIAVHAAGNRVRAACDDGAILEGNLT